MVDSQQSNKRQIHSISSSTSSGSFLHKEAPPHHCHEFVLSEEKHLSCEWDDQPHFIQEQKVWWWALCRMCWFCFKSFIHSDHPNIPSFLCTLHYRFSFSIIIYVVLLKSSRLASPHTDSVQITWPWSVSLIYVPWSLWVAVCYNLLASPFLVWKENERVRESDTRSVYVACVKRLIDFIEVEGRLLCFLTTVRTRIFAQSAAISNDSFANIPNRRRSSGAARQTPS